VRYALAVSGCHERREFFDADWQVTRLSGIDFSETTTGM
jgi:hypothetical protein